MSTQLFIHSLAENILSPFSSLLSRSKSYGEKPKDASECKNYLGGKRDRIYWEHKAQISDLSNYWLVTEGGNTEKKQALFLENRVGDTYFWVHFWADSTWDAGGLQQTFGYIHLELWRQGWAEDKPMGATTIKSVIKAWKWLRLCRESMRRSWGTLWFKE